MSPRSPGLLALLRDFALALIRQAGRAGALATVLVAGGAVLEGVSIVLLVPILGVVFGQDMAGVGARLAAFGLSGGIARLTALLAAFVAAMAVRAAVLYARDVRLAALQADFVAATRDRLMTALATAPWSRVALLDHARVTNLTGVELGRIAVSAQYLIQGAVALAMLGVQVALAFLLAPPIALAAALVLAIGAAVTVAGGRRTHALGAGLVAANQALVGSTAGFLTGLKAAAAEGTAPYFLAEVGHVQATMRGHLLAFVARQARSRLVFALGSAVGGAGVVLGGVVIGLAPGVLITLVVLFARMSGPATVVQAALQNLFFGLPGFAAIRALEGDLAAPGTVTTPRAPPPGDIVLDAVRYRHAGGGGIEAATLCLAPGEFVGIVGPSGAGKTTLVDLLAGLLVPQAGNVAVGGAELDGALRAGWRTRVGYVGQEGWLFNDSVRRNLAWGVEADDEAIAAALAVTGADRVVAGLAAGLDTVVGERGARLSGGERQRLALARALLRRPRLLVLDEATNAIDPQGEAELLDRLAALAPRPTIVMVAHRPTSLSRCGRVIRVEAGTASD